VHPVFGPEPVSEPAQRRRYGEEDQRGRYQFIDREGLTNDRAEQIAFCACALPLGAFQMLAWILLVVSTPTIVSTTCSAFLAYKERPQWIWLVLAEIGGVVMLAAVQAQRLTY
jgi:hypothetical protein